MSPARWQPKAARIPAQPGNDAGLPDVRARKGIDTGKGFTPTAGIPMGTRPRDLDPGAAQSLLPPGQKGSGGLHVNSSTNTRLPLMKYHFQCIELIYGKKFNCKGSSNHQRASELLTLPKQRLVVVRFQWPGKMVGTPCLVVSLDLGRGLTSGA
jgi:hypothetical protein